MVDKKTPDKDLVQEAFERKHMNVEDVQNQKNKEQEAWKEVEDTREDLNKEKETWKEVADTQEDLNKEKEKVTTQQETKETLSVFSLITKTDVLIDKYKDFKRHANRYSRNKEDKWYEKAFKWQAENRIRRLENIKRFLDKYENKPWNLDQASLNRYNREIKNINDEVALFEQWRDEIVMEKTWGQTPYNIDVHTEKDANKLIKARDRVNGMLRKLDALELDLALKTELKEDLEWLQKYLEDSINWKIDAGRQPFQLKHWEDFVQLGIIDPDLYSEIIYPYSNNNKNNNNTANGTPNNGQNNAATNQEYNKNMACKPVQNYNNLDEARKKWWVMWAIDYGFQKTNMTPQQRQFWHGAWNLALIWGGIFLGIKALKSVFGIFSKDEKKRSEWWGWLAWIAWWTLVLQGLTWKNPIQAIKELFNWWDTSRRISALFGGWTSGSPTWAEITPNTPQEAITYVHGFSGVPGIFGWATIDQMKAVITKDKNWMMKINQAWYQSLIAKFKTENKPDVVNMLEKLKWVNEDDNDKHNIIHLTLEWMWITYDKLQQGWTEKFDNYAVSALARLKSINEFMVQHKYATMNIEFFRDDVKKYIANGDPSLVALEEAGLFKSWLTQKQTVASVDSEINNFNETSDVLWLKAKVALLKIPDDQKRILVASWNILSKQTNNNNNIEFKEGLDGLVYLKTYWEWTAVNVATNTMPGLTSQNIDIFFKSTMEMIKAANLTNYIKKMFRWRSIQFDKPFEITNALDLIKLNGIWDLVFKEKDKDPNLKRYNPKKYDPSYVEVIDAWWFSDLWNLSPTVNKYTNEYATYLNNLDIWKQNKKTNDLPS